jgi:hypothetical protein
MARGLRGSPQCLRDETTVFHTQSASEQAQLVNMARRALNGTVIVIEGEGLKPRLTGDGLAATRG